jgi:hypothetical protein
LDIFRAETLKEEKNWDVFGCGVVVFVWLLVHALNTLMLVCLSALSYSAIGSDFISPKKGLKLGNNI